MGVNFYPNRLVKKSLNWKSNPKAMQELLDRLTPDFIRSWDQKLLVKDPLLWSTRIVMVLAAATGLLVLSQADAWLTTIRPDSLPSIEGRFWLWFIPSIGVLVYWLIRVNALRPDRYFGGKSDDLALRMHVAYLVGTFALAAIPFLNAYTLSERLKASFVEEDIKADIAITDVAHSYAQLLYSPDEATTSDFDMSTPREIAKNAILSPETSDDEALIAAYFASIKKYGGEVPDQWDTRGVISRLRNDGYSWTDNFSGWTAENNMNQIEQSVSSRPIFLYRLDFEYAFILTLVLMFGLGASVIASAGPKESLLAIGLGLSMIVAVPVSVFLMSFIFGRNSFNGHTNQTLMILLSLAGYVLFAVLSSRLRPKGKFSLFQGGMLALLTICTPLVPIFTLVFLDLNHIVEAPNMGNGTSDWFVWLFFPGSALLAWASWVKWYRPKMIALHALPEHR